MHVYIQQPVYSYTCTQARTNKHWHTDIRIWDVMSTRLLYWLCCERETSRRLQQHHWQRIFALFSKKEQTTNTPLSQCVCARNICVHRDRHVIGAELNRIYSRLLLFNTWLNTLNSFLVFPTDRNMSTYFYTLKCQAVCYDRFVCVCVCVKNYRN